MNHPFLSSAIENSHIIQVYTSSRTIWRGEEWSSVILDVKVDQSITEKKDPHILVAFLERIKGKSLHLPWESDQVKIKFEKHELEGRPFEADVEQSEAKNKLKVKIHKDLFDHGDKFRVIVAAHMKRDRSKSIVFGASQQISVTNFALSIEQRFDNHDAVVKVDDSTYVYYNKLVSKFYGLEVAIHLLSDDGKICKSPMPTMKLRTELVYEDGIPVPIMPMKPLKITGRRNSSGTVSRSEKPILRNLDCKQPCLGKNKSSTLFRFLLEEVTYHHHGHDGYKLKVSVDNSRNIVVHPGVMKELMVVLSKPKRMNSECNSCQQSAPTMKSMDRKTFVVQKREAVNRCNSTKRKLSDFHDEPCFDTTHLVAKRSKVQDINSIISQSPNGKAFIKISDILQAYGFNGMCFVCRSPVDIKTILRAEHHTVTCAFVEKLLPLFQNVDTSKLSHDQGDMNVNQMVEIMNSQSFEELCKDFMNTAPCEVFDTNVFAVDANDDNGDDSSIHDHHDIQATLDYRHLMISCKDKLDVLKNIDSKEDEVSTTLPIITGENIFRSTKVEETNNNEQDDFLSFLDHLIKDQHDDDNSQANDIPLKSDHIKQDTPEKQR